MDIFWLGNSTFRLKGKNATLLIDPVDNKGVADIVLQTKSGSFPDVPAETTRVFEGAGEYESKGVMIMGVANGDTTVYQIIMDGLQIVHLSAAVELSDFQQTDILMTPIASAVADLEPKIIIPFAPDTETMAKLTKELGAEGGEVLPKLTVSKDKLPDEPSVTLLENAR